MSLLVSSVFGDEVEVFSADNESSMHFGRNDLVGEDSTSDGDHAGKGTFLVWYIQESAINSLIRDSLVLAVVATREGHDVWCLTIPR